MTSWSDQRPLSVADGFRDGVCLKMGGYEVGRLWVEAPGGRLRVMGHGGSGAGQGGMSSRGRRVAGRRRDPGLAATATARNRDREIPPVTVMSIPRIPTGFQHSLRTWCGPVPLPRHGAVLRMRSRYLSRYRRKVPRISDAWPNAARRGVQGAESVKK